MRLPLLVFVLTIPALAPAQDINVEYDKNRDLSRYKSFSIGGGEITTPRDQRQAGDTVVLNKIETAVIKELTAKGLLKKDSIGDLIVSYIIGSLEKSEYRNV